MLDRFSIITLSVGAFVALSLILALFSGYQKQYHVQALEDFYHEQRYAAAIPHLEYAVAHNIRVDYYGMLLGDCYFELGKFDKALAAYQHTLKVAPQVAIQDRIGATQIELGHAAEAQEAFKKAQLQNPNSPIMNYYFGRQAMNEGRFVQASQFLFKTQSNTEWNERAEKLRTELTQRLFANSPNLPLIEKLPAQANATTNTTTQTLATPPNTTQNAGHSTGSVTLTTPTLRP